ncbi:DUF3313 domain-containing protein (plasmid) [Morganella morganii]|uniref:DUF3313 domain-containing protein n=1 Tax=Morganella morganii TaxID=582 RepID=A0A433ZQP8_MORMO|nr:DUF3313 domain-containing protein [Morganella morganii]RUT64450.1 DUF3313 domain-containing protein [Morganella morganii]
MNNFASHSVTKYIIAASMAFLMSACSNRLPDTTEQSDFLSDYQRLTETDTASSHVIKSWLSEDFTAESPKAKLIFTPVVFKPLNENNKMGKQFMTVLLSYINQQIKSELAKQYLLTETAAPGVLRFEGVVTAVKVTNKDFKPYEVLPVMLIVAGTQLAIGNRDADTSVYFEWKITDSVSKKPYLEAIRKNKGEQMSNKDQTITLQELKAAVDTIAAEVLPAA